MCIVTFVPKNCYFCWIEQGGMQKSAGLICVAVAEIMSSNKKKS